MLGDAKVDEHGNVLDVKDCNILYLDKDGEDREINVSFILIVALVIFFCFPFGFCLCLVQLYIFCMLFFQFFDFFVHYLFISLDTS